MIKPTYLGEIELSEETLTHYGVKGMKWRHRKGKKKNQPKTTDQKPNQFLVSKVRPTFDKNMTTLYKGSWRDRYKKDTRLRTNSDGSVDLITDNMTTYERDNRGRAYPVSTMRSDLIRKRRKN